VAPPIGLGGVYYTAATDSAPDSGISKDANGTPVAYTIGDTCSGGGGGGATPAHLTLSPKTETDTVDTQASETATVTDTNNNPVPNVVVRFAVTGANAGTYTQTTDQFGQGKITYTGGNTGTDNISAYADTNNSNTKDSGEPSDTATKTWNAPVTMPCTVKITTGGWIIADDGAKSSFGGNAQAATNGSLSGSEQFQDKTAKVDMHSINVTAVTCPSPTQAQIFGTATINGSGSYQYTITVQDGSTTNQPDRYGIKVGSYSSGQHDLGGGTIDIHKN
jgi:Bacterial Ig-like domain (group 1)